VNRFDTTLLVFATTLGGRRDRLVRDDGMMPDDCRRFSEAVARDGWVSGRTTSDDQ